MDQNSIKSALSHAYIHALAARNGYRYLAMPWEWDYAGIDAKIAGAIRVPGDVDPYSVEIDVQLKATSRKTIPPIGEHIPLSIPVKQYNRLREGRYFLTLLVAVFLPEDPDHWLRCSPDGIALGGRAYWVSLRGAPVSKNASEQTVYIPKSQELTADGLTKVLSEFAVRRNPDDSFFLYQPPN